MNEGHRIKCSGRLLILLLILVRLPLLSWLPEYGALNVHSPFMYARDSFSVSGMAPPSDHIQSSHENSKADHIQHIQRNVFALMAYGVLSMDDGVVHSDSVHLHHPNSFGDENPFSVVLFYVLLCGLIFVFLCFGTLPGMLFVRGFTRYTVIPHSIHAPPCFCRETFEISGQIC